MIGAELHEPDLTKATDRLGDRRTLTGLTPEHRLDLASSSGAYRQLR